MVLLDRIDKWGRNDPDRVAHRTAGAELTWHDLLRRSDLLAGAIAQAKIPPASPVVLRGHKEPEMLIGFLAEQLLDRFPAAEVWNTYGPTEATVATTSVRIDRELLRRYPQLPIGVAMPGTSVTIEDESGCRVADGIRGEIVIAGPNVSPGYLGRPDLTARSFFARDGVRAYRTGDWGVVHDDLLFFQGRKDNQVKIAGHRIEVGDVETHLAGLPMVRGAAGLPALRDGALIPLLSS